MKVIHGLSSIARSATPVVLTIGNFDGLHLGHRALVSQVIESARKTGALSTVMTFDPHPTRVVRPETPSPRLFGVDDLIEQLAALNVDQLVIEPFTRELAQLPPDKFLQYVFDHLLIRKLFIGHDFKFGHDREGSGSTLKEWSEKNNFELSEVEPFKFQNAVVSSTLIRKHLVGGDVEHAAQLLARPYYLEGKVTPGDGRGHKIGFATANLACVSEVIPAAGVYVTRCICRGERMNSISNVGYKPTFHDKGPLTVETHVLDQERDFLGETVRLEFLKRLRDEMKFPNPQALVSQIKSDVAAARTYFAAEESGGAGV